VNGPVTESRSYDAADQVVGWTYDGAGNLLNDGSNTYTYDALKRLAQVDRTPGQTYVYTYNGDNVLEREQRTGPFGWIVTYFTLDSTGNGALPERLGAKVNNGTTSWYMRGWGQELSRESFSGQANTVSWYLPDRLGSVRAEMDDVGGLSTTYNYDPFGTPEGSTAPEDYGFTGEPQTSLLGLVHLRARWYNTASGRFQSHDPFAGWLVRPMSLHAYMYVHDDPVNGRDPSGFTCIPGADILKPGCEPTPGIDPNDDVWDFLFGIAAAWTDDNTFYVHPDAKQPVVQKPDDSAATATGRFVGHLLAMAQGLAEFGAGAGGIAAGGILCLTGVGCVVGAAAMVASSALAAHGAAVCTSTAIHAGTELGRVAFSSGSKGGAGGSQGSGAGSGKTLAQLVEELEKFLAPRSRTWTSREALLNDWQEHGRKYKTSDEYLNAANNFVNNITKNGRAQGYRAMDGTVYLWDPQSLQFAQLNERNQIVNFYIADGPRYFQNAINRIPGGLDFKPANLIVP